MKARVPRGSNPGAIPVRPCVPRNLPLAGISGRARGRMRRRRAPSTNAHGQPPGLPANKGGGLARHPETEALRGVDHTQKPAAPRPVTCWTLRSQGGLVRDAVLAPRLRDAVEAARRLTGARRGALRQKRERFFLRPGLGQKEKDAPFAPGRREPAGRQPGMKLFRTNEVRYPGLLLAGGSSAVLLREGGRSLGRLKQKC